MGGERPGKRKVGGNEGIYSAVKVSLVGAVVALAAATGGGAALSWWLRGEPVSALRPRVPLAADKPAAGAGTVGKSIAATGRLRRGPGKPADLPGAWPRFRGPNGDGVSPETISLARRWGPRGPPVLWTIKVGEGYAGAAVAAGRVYLLDYDREAQADALRCLSLADGAEIWRFSYPVKVKRNHGMSRTVPAVTDKYVVGMGPKCYVTCVDAKTGELLWARDLVKEFGTKVPDWYTGQCPLIDGGRAILAPAGDEVLMLAVDCATGKIVWKAPNRRGWKMSHSSVMPMTVAGRRTYVYCADGGVAGVSAADGKVLWETSAWRVNFATIPAPIPLADGRLFLSGGYGAGAMMMRIAVRDGGFVPEVVFRLKEKVFGSEQQTPLLYKRNIYAVRPDKQLVCLSLDGKLRWSSGPAHRFGPRGLGPYLIADGLLFVLNDRGRLTLAEATPEGYKELAAARIFDGRDAWGPLALVGGRLLLRDLTRLVCLDVRRPAAPARRRSATKTTGAAEATDGKKEKRDAEPSGRAGTRR